MIVLSSAPKIPAADVEKLKSVLAGLRAQLDSPKELSATAKRRVKTAIAAITDLLAVKVPSTKDFQRVARSMKRLATSEEIYPAEVVDRRTHEHLEKFGPHVREHEGQPQERSLMPISGGGRVTEVMPFWRDEPQNRHGLTRSMLEPAKITEDILVALDREMYISAQDAFDGHVQEGGPYGHASFGQKKALAQMLRSNGFVVKFDEDAGWALDNARRKNNRTIGYEKAEPKSQLPLALGKKATRIDRVAPDPENYVEADHEPGHKKKKKRRRLEPFKEGNDYSMLGVTEDGEKKKKRPEDITHKMPPYMMPGAKKRRAQVPSIDQLGRNFSRVGLPGDRSVWFSYKTPIAFQSAESGLVVRQNDWGPTTGRHMNAIDGGARGDRIDGQAFETMLNQEFTTSPEMREHMPLFTAEKIRLSTRASTLQLHVASKKKKKKRKYHQEYSGGSPEAGGTPDGGSIDIPGGPPGSAPSVGGGAAAVKLSSYRRRQAQVLLNSDEDMEWLRDVHLPDLPNEYQSAIIYGNEDAPDRIDVFMAREPTIDDVAVVFKPDEDYENYHQVS